MNRVTLICVSVTAFQFAVTSAADESSDSVKTTAEQIVSEFAKDYPALNVSVSMDGNTVWEHSAGALLSEKDGVTSDYNAYSVAKMITGMAYAKLVFRGDLSLDTHVREIDPSLPDHYEPIQIKHLLSHISGIRHYTSGTDWSAFADMRCETPADALSHFLDDPLVAQPGEKHQYTTFGFTLLSHLLTILTGEETYDGAMHAVLGEYYLVTTDSDDAIKAINYERENGAYKEIDSINAQCKFGGGGILASARDLSTMGAHLYSGDIIDLEDIPSAFAPVKTSDGNITGHAFGMNAGQSRTIQPAIYYAAHSGGSPGGRAYMAVLIEPKVSVGITANYDGPGMSDLAFDLAGLFAGLERTGN